MSAQQVETGSTDGPVATLIHLGLDHPDMSISTWEIGGWPIASVVATITPDMAREWLRSRNPSIKDTSDGNRNMTAKATTYAEEMRIGEWETTPQCVIAFDEHGTLLDGQHRLTAVSRQESGREFIVQAGWPRSGFAKIDIGAVRAGRQFIAKWGSDKTAAARVLMAVSGAVPATQDIINARPLNPAMELDWVRQWPELHDESLLKLVNQCYRSTRINRPLHLAVLAMVRRSPHAELISGWMEGLTTGAGLAGTDPRLHLRNRWLADYRSLVGSSSNRVVAYTTIAKMWNAFVLGTPVKQLKVTKGEEIPKVTGFRPLRSTRR